MARSTTSPPLQILLVAMHNPAARQIVRRKLDRDFVSRQNPDEILAHFAGNVRQDLVLVLQLNAEHRVRQRLDHRGHHFNGVLLGISGVAFLFFLANRSCHSLPCLSRRSSTLPLHLLPRRPGHLLSSARSSAARVTSSSFCPPGQISPPVPVTAESP